MADDSQIAMLRVDVQHLQSDVTEIKADTRSLRDSVERLRAEFLSSKTEVAKEFGSFGSEMAKEIGSVRTSIERAKLWMVVTGVGTILSVWGAALALARFLKP